MINFRQKHEVLPSALILISLIVLALTLCYYLYITFDRSAAKFQYTSMDERKLQQLQLDTANLKLQEDSALGSIAPDVWSSNVEQVSAAVLARLTDVSTQHGVTITSFRPSKPTPINGVTQLPFTVQMSGPYQGIQAVLASIDAPSSKVALQQIQLASAQASQGTVTTNVDMAAFLNTDPADIPIGPAPASAPQAKPRPKEATS